MAYFPVNVETFRKKDFVVVFTILALLLAGVFVASINGPTQLIIKAPDGGIGSNIPIKTRTCSHNASDASIEPVFQCWNHKFVFHARWTQYFSVDVVAKKASTELSTEIRRFMKLHVTWYGQTQDSQGTYGPWEAISDGNVTRAILCPIGQLNCTRFVVFKTSHVVYQRYYFQISLVDSPDTLAFLDTVSFVFMYRNKDFALYELGFKIAFVLANLFVFVAFFVLSIRQRGGSNMRATPEQRWVLWLLGTLMLFNNPLFPLEYALPARPIFGALSVIFQFTFIACLLFFWLAQFDLMSREDDGPVPFKSFYLPKLLYIGTFYAVGVVAYTLITVKTFVDPLYNWYEDTEHWDFIRAYGIALGVSYLIFASVLVWHAFKGVFFSTSAGVTRENVEAAFSQAAGSRARAWLFIFHLFVLLVSVAGLLLGAVMQLQVDTALDFLFYHALFNVYAYALAFMFLPAPGGHHSIEERAALSEAVFDDDDSSDDGQGLPGLAGGPPPPPPDRDLINSPRRAYSQGGAFSGGGGGGARLREVELSVVTAEEEEEESDGEGTI